jgi:phenylacetate-CoA ligase
VEVTDLVTLDPDPWRCGRPLVRASAIHGRSDDVLSLPTRAGGRVRVHPLQFALLTRDPQVREFQVVQDGPALRVRIVPSHAAAAGDTRLEARLGRAVTRQLQGLGVHDPHVTVERRQQLARSAGGKLKLVIADPAAQPVPLVHDTSGS